LTDWRRGWKVFQIRWVTRLRIGLIKLYLPFWLNVVLRRKAAL